MNTLIIGGTGTVGTQVVRELLARGVNVRILTRNPEKARLPAGAAAVRGDLLDPGTARTVFRGIDRVFMLNATGPTEAHEGLMGVSGAQAAGVKRLVYLSLNQLDAAPACIPHFGSKVPIEAAVRASGMEWTIIRPNNFFQNEAWFKDAILTHGVYPQPIGSRGLSRVDVRDIAEAAAIALTQPGHSGQTYELVGPDILTGADTAAIWTVALGRPVSYAGDNLDQWENTFRPYRPAWQLYDFRLMDEWFQSHGFAGSSHDVARLTKLLGHPPRSLETYARETAPAWLREKARPAA